jgi:hypothetical protein
MNNRDLPLVTVFSRWWVSQEIKARGLAFSSLTVPPVPKVATTSVSPALENSEQKRTVMKKKEIPPFKMLPVELREHLHELTGNELKVWLCLYLHSDKTKEAFPSNSLIVQETGLSKKTVKAVKASLRKKAWIISQQRYRDNGSLSTMGEKIASPRCKHFTYVGGETTPIQVSKVLPPQVPPLHPPEVDTLEVDTEKPDTSKPQDQNPLVSKSVSETPFASLTTSERQENQKPVHSSLATTKPDDSLWDRDQEQAWLAQERIPYWSEELNRGLGINEVIIAEELYLDLIPMGKMDEADIATLTELTLAYQTDDTHGQAVIRSIWHWNKLHKKDSLQFHTIQALAKAMRSESDNNVVIQWHEHNRAECPKCKKLRKCVQCGLLEDGTVYDLGSSHPAGTYLHKGCYMACYNGGPTYQERESHVPENICCQLGYDSEGAEHSKICWNYKKPANGFGGGTEHGACGKCLSQGFTICGCDECWEPE